MHIHLLLLVLSATQVAAYLHSPYIHIYIYAVVSYSRPLQLATHIPTNYIPYGRIMTCTNNNNNNNNHHNQNHPPLHAADLLLVPVHPLLHVASPPPSIAIQSLSARLHSTQFNVYMHIYSALYLLERSSALVSSPRVSRQTH